ncbi:MAG: penicillin-binding protein 1A, partial [Candidatus Nealsonbacteria bacterium CG10_big_fil_rev_8_21_14_0_10_36_24]
MAERKFYRKIYKKNRERKILSWIFLFFCFCFLFFIFAFLFLFIYYAKDLPRPEKFTERTFIESTKIYDRTGATLLYELYGETKREIIPLSQVPEHLKQAIIATEDANFYSHFGIDFKGIIRSIKINLKIGQPLYGGSTISQQLIRSTFLTREKSIKRKIREIILTLEVERRYSKDQILEWYLNQIPLGVNIYGVETAAKTYFNKPAKELTITESAVLAALIKAPSYYSPFGA